MAPGPRQFQLFAIAALVALVLIALGPSLRARRVVAELRWPLVVVSSVTLIVLDVPVGHGNRCGMSYGAAFASCGVWWLPYAAYASVSIHVAVRLLGGVHEREGPDLAARHASVVLAAVLLELATHWLRFAPWWLVHVLLQGALLRVSWRSVAPSLRPALAGLVAVPLVVPFLPLSFWHATARLRVGDSVEDVLRKLDGYWLVSQEDTSERVPVAEVDASSLAGAPRLLFGAVDGSDACTCAVELRDGRLASFLASPD